MNENIIKGLLKKRSELIGKIIYYNKEIKSLSLNLNHIDSTIKLFDPNCFR